MLFLFWTIIYFAPGGFVSNLMYFSGGNQMYTSLKHGHKQGSHRNSHREIPARHEDVGGNY